MSFFQLVSFSFANIRFSHLGMLMIFVSVIGGIIVGLMDGRRLAVPPSRPSSIVVE